MATNDNHWQTSRTEFGALGTKTFFVDWSFGSNETGDGTPEHPYKKIQYGFDMIVASGNTPSGCVVRGAGNESFIGNHAFTIKGDYMGAAVWDGGGTAQIIYCTMRNIIYINGGHSVSIDYTSIPYGNSILAAFAGCGRASYARTADRAGDVYGVASSPMLIENSKLYRGCIGGSGVNFNIYSKIKCPPFMQGQSNCGVTFGGGSAAVASRLRNCTVYDLPLSVREVAKSTQTNALHAYRWLFGKVDFIYEHNDTFFNCMFLSDCNFYFVDKTSGNVYSGLRLKLKFHTVAPNEDVISADAVNFIYDSTDVAYDFTGAPTGGSLTVSGVDITSIYDAFLALYANGNITINPTTVFLGDCLFSNCASNQIFNNPEKTDFTIRHDCEAIIDGSNYFGALPPAFSIPVIGSANSGSDSVKNCWDNRSVAGCLKVEDGIIKIDTASQETSGQILSKVIKCNPQTMQFNGIYAKFSKRVMHGWIASKINPFGTAVTQSGELEANTKYVVKGGNVTVDNVVYDADDIIDTAMVSDTTATLAAGAKLYPVLDCNIPDTIYCRCRSMVYAQANIGDTLIEQVTYMNEGDRYIKYHDRVIVPGESFICDNAESYVVCNASGVVDDTVTDYPISVIFDDREVIPLTQTRIGGRTEWIPAQMFGQYFVMKNAGAITKLTIPQIGDVAKSSGNYMCFTKHGNGAIMDGFKSILNQYYMQFALFVTKVSEANITE